MKHTAWTKRENIFANHESPTLCYLLCSLFYVCLTFVWLSFTPLLIYYQSPSLCEIAHCVRFTSHCALHYYINYRGMFGKQQSVLLSNFDTVTFSPSWSWPTVLATLKLYLIKLAYVVCCSRLLWDYYSSDGTVLYFHKDYYCLFGLKTGKKINTALGHHFGHNHI